MVYFGLQLRGLVAAPSPEDKSEIRRGKYRGTSERRLPDDYAQICGKQDTRFIPTYPTFRIINGSCSPYGSFPWVAQIQTRQSGKYVHHCGGTILTEDFVLTAAHCLQQVSSGHIRVVSGQQDLSTIDEEERAFDVEQTAIHEDWDSPKFGRYSNDIALVKIRRKGDGNGFRFSSGKVVPACLPKVPISLEDRKCLIAGWGKTGEKTEIEKTCLRSAVVPILEQDRCKSLYKSLGKNIFNGMMCAGFENGGIDSCKGDSGGPLVCEHRDRYHIHGIVSWGQGCGKKGRPGVYSNVQKYVQWINYKIGSML